MLKIFSRSPSASVPMNRSTNNSLQDTIPGGPSPDYESTETQHTSASGAPAGSDPQTLSGARGITDKPSQEGTDVVPVYSVVSRGRNFSIAPQSTGNTSSNPGPQPAQHSDIEGNRPPVPGPRSEPSSGATPAASVAADPKPILSGVKSPSEEASGVPLSHGPSDATPLRPGGLSPSLEAAPAGRDPQRSVSLVSHDTGHSLAANGAATAANDPPDVGPGLQARAVSAADEAVISKEETSVGRRLSKIIRSEARTEKASLDVALWELCEIQKRQKVSVKEEAESHTRHSRALSDAHKAEMKLLIARTANEREQAGLRAAEEELEACRKHARETTNMLRDKMQEVERLRVHKGMDDRERAVKVKSLNGQRRKGLGRVLPSA